MLTSRTVTATTQLCKSSETLKGQDGRPFTSRSVRTATLFPASLRLRPTPRRSSSRNKSTGCRAKIRGNVGPRHHEGQNQQQDKATARLLRPADFNSGRHGREPQTLPSVENTLELAWVPAAAIHGGPGSGGAARTSAPGYLGWKQSTSRTVRLVGARLILAGNLAGLPWKQLPYSRLQGFWQSGSD